MRGLVGPEVHVERAARGTSTPVYRLGGGSGAAYLRLGEHRDHRLDVEVEAHRRLRELGVRVPEVVAFEPFDERLQRPVMVVAALRGTSLAEAPLPSVEAELVYREAGRDLARLASLPVDGFGFLQRVSPAVWPPRAPYPSAAAALLDGWDAAAIEELLGAAANPARAAALRRTRTWAASELGDGVPARLAHGDVDPNHIFHEDGRYTGLIDLGELQGAPLGSDLARVLLWSDDEVALPALTAGFDDLAPPAAASGGRALAQLGALQGMHHLARWWHRDGHALFARSVAVRLAGQVAALADGLVDAR